jgi:hypothetical protein
VAAQLAASQEALSSVSNTASPPCKPSKETSIMRRGAGVLCPNYTALRPRREKSSHSPLWEAQIQHDIEIFRQNSVNRSQFISDSDSNNRHCAKIYVWLCAHLDCNSLHVSKEGEMSSTKFLAVTRHKFYVRYFFLA